MTGIEAVVVPAALGAAKEATHELKSNREQRREEQQALLEEAKKTEGFKQAAALKGKKLAVKEAMALIIMKPVARVIGVNREYFDTTFPMDYAQSISEIPEANLQTPKASIAGPVFEGLGYSVDEPELKSMYLELLARASDDRAARTAHPSFVQVVRELTSEEAVYLSKYIGSEDQNYPIGEYRLQYHPGLSHVVLATNVLDVRDDQGAPVEDEMLPTYVDNWVRLKLVSVSYESTISAADVYDWEQNRPERASAQAHVDTVNTPDFEEYFAQAGHTSAQLQWKKGVMSATAFGREFARAVGLASEK